MVRLLLRFQPTRKSVGVIAPETGSTETPSTSWECAVGVGYAGDRLFPRRALVHFRDQSPYYSVRLHVPGGRGGLMETAPSPGP